MQKSKGGGWPVGRGEGKRGQCLRPVKKLDYNITSKIEEPIKIDLRKES